MFVEVIKYCFNKKKGVGNKKEFEKPTKRRSREINKNNFLKKS